ncbi:MAG: ROK family protein [Bryobacteraceae bacterium]
MSLYGGIEGGGTKFVCAVGDENGKLLFRTEFPTTTPTETIGRVLDFFASHRDLAAIGIGSFGPVDLNPHSQTYGYITTTPKPGWRQTEFGGAIQKATGLRVAFETDVNTAALGEARWGAAQGLDTFMYLTIGTGIGGGGIVNGHFMHGLVHPEMGHIRIPHDRAVDPFPGACPFHGDCLEGLASGPALEARWGQRGETIPAGHIAWEIEAGYLAYALANWICTLSPQKIIMGGGVMKQLGLFERIRRKVLDLLNSYIQSPQILECIDSYIVPPALGGDAGVSGAIALAAML